MRRARRDKTSKRRARFALPALRPNFFVHGFSFEQLSPITPIP
jgi:hypothetical protein